MEIVESYDSFLDTTWKVKEGVTTMAICYNKEIAEVCRAAIEKHQKEKAEEAKREYW